MAHPERLTLDPAQSLPPTRDHPDGVIPQAMPVAKETRQQPTIPGVEDAGLYFVGNATTILEWAGVRVMTDPNFLHAGDHVHLGPGVTATRVANPAVDLADLPRIDLILLSHYHEDHFDKKVEESLRRDLPIITTPHAKSHLSEKPGEKEAFTAVYELDTFNSMVVDIRSSTEEQPRGSSRVKALKVTAMPGKHVPSGVLGTLNDLLGAVPPTNGWMLELGSFVNPDDASFKCRYRIYISGDTLLVDELKEIPERYANQSIDLMLVHLGGTTIPGPHAPLLMVTMDAKQGLELVRLIGPKVTIPIHFDDYDIMLSSLEDFKKAITEAGLEEKVVYLDRGDIYRFLIPE